MVLSFILPLFYQLFATEANKLHRKTKLTEEHEISCGWSLSIPPENIRKLQVVGRDFLIFSGGVEKEISGMSWVNNDIVTSPPPSAHYLYHLLINK